MAEKSVQRRKAAILAGHVVGYRRLIRADEEGTAAAIKNFRDQLIDPGIVWHEGRTVKTMGDGVLVEFPSVFDAAHEQR